MMNWLKQITSRRRHCNELSESIRKRVEEKIADPMGDGMTREEAEKLRSVSQRTRETGVRMALGAQCSTIGRLILGEAAYLVLLGLVFGIAASFLTGRFLHSLPFGVRSWDLSILTGVSTTFVVATLIAA
jgi:hypothetical protein